MLHDITQVLFVMQKHVSEALCRFSNLLLKYIHITGFILLFWDRFKDFFQDSDWFYPGLKISLFPKNSKSIFLTVHLHFSYRKNSENFISRVLSRFPGLESPGKLQNKIPGLSRFSRTPQNPDIRAFDKLTFLENAGQMLAQQLFFNTRNQRFSRKINKKKQLY